MKTVLKRILSLVLSLCLLIGFVPAVGTAHAAPSGLKLTYTGQDQSLVTAEPGYTYSLRADGPFDDAAPTATAVGTYMVYCKNNYDGTVIRVNTVIRPVAVPLRIDVDHVGPANLVMAYSRLPYIGGSRAVYE